MKSIDARTLTPAAKQAILDRDDRCCGYCGAVAECVDHIVPWSHTKDNHPDNLIAACWLCNGIAGNKIFETVSEKRRHVLNRVEHLLKKRRVPIWLSTDIQKLGPGLRDRVASTSVVVDTVEDRESVRAHIERLGLLTT